MTAPRILFLDMPLRGVRGGALGLSTLKAILAREGIDSDIRYANVEFADRIGVSFYETMSRLGGGQYRGEIFFSPHFYGVESSDFTDYLRPYFAGLTLPRSAEIESDRGEWHANEFLRRCEEVCREVVPQFLAALVDSIDWERYDIVGFSLMFDQTLASLCVAKWIREHHPDKLVLFGGSSCHGEMGVEMARAFDCVDVVATGEADTAIVDLVRALRAGEPLDRIPEIAFRRGGTVVRTEPAPLLRDLDWLPLPDYDDYFAAVRKAGITPAIYFETSRGCWWGQKHLCSFCGLNTSGLAFRRKSAARALEEIVTLSEKYECPWLAATDNIIDLSYFKDVLPQLAAINRGRARGERLQLFYEMKSNVHKEQLALMHDAGIIAVQPGIESFNDHVLRLMDKGSTGIQQIQFVKWATEIGISMRYGVIYGCPGERPEDYDEMREAVPFLSHLAPPKYVGEISLDRFSPYFMNPQHYGIRDVRPHENYRRIFRENRVKIEEIAYSFVYDHDDHHDEPLREAIRRCSDALMAWRDNFRADALVYDVTAEGVTILDRRGDTPRLTVLRGMQAEIFLYLDEHHALPQIQRQFAPASPDEVAAFVELLRQRKWLYKDGQGRCIALPIRRDLRAYVREGQRVVPLPPRQSVAERAIF